MFADAGAANIALAISPTTGMVTVGAGTLVKIYALGDGHLVHTLTGPPGFVSGLGFSADGQILVSGTTDGAIRAWDTHSGDTAAAYHLPGNGYVNDVDIDPQAQRIAATSTDGNAYVFTCDVCASGPALAQLAQSHTTRSLTADERSIFGVP